MIPRLIHQIWVGPLPKPTELMQTWYDLNPGWRHVFWRDHTLQVGVEQATADGHLIPWGSRRPWRNQSIINRCGEWCGKADAMRYEILFEHGGVFVDADSECVRPLDDQFARHEAWCCRQNETDCGLGLANGYLGARAGSPLMADMIAGVASAESVHPAWQMFGPTLLNRVAAMHPELHVYPARMFLPQHYTGTVAPGNAPVYARQHWAGTRGLYEHHGGRWAEHIAVDPPPAPVVDHTPRPTVSVVIPCYGPKQAEWLSEAVASVEAQTFKDWELIITAGGAHAEGRAEAIKARTPGVRVVNQVVSGLGDARNRGIEIARGRLILCLDADDLIVPTHLEKTVAAMGDTELGIVTTAMKSFGDSEGEWCLEDKWAGILEENAVLTCSLYTRRLWEAVGGYDVSMLGWEDWAYWIACSEYKPRVVYLKETLFLYRTHGTSMTKWDEQNDAGRFHRAMIHLRHPSLYSTARLEEARRTMRGMTPATLQRLWERANRFPGHHGLVAFLKLVNGGAPAQIAHTPRGRWFDGRHET